MFKGLLQKLIERPEYLRRIIIFKLIVAGVMFAVLKDVIFIGDASTQAADEKVAESKATDAKTDEPAKTAAAKTEGDAPKKSILDRLLNLPSIDPSSAKKDELGKYLALAEKKKQQVEDRFKALEKQAELLATLEKSIDLKLQQLDEERQFIAQTMQREKDLKGKRLDRLIELYGKMDARKAAPVMEKLDKDLVVEMFKALSQKQVTKILEAMSPQKSVELTEYYGRVRSGREYDLLKEMNKSLKKEFDECKGMGEKALEDSDETAAKPAAAQPQAAAANAPAPAAAPAEANASAPAAPAAPAAAPASAEPGTAEPKPATDAPSEPKTETTPEPGKAA